MFNKMGPNMPLTKEQWAAAHPVKPDAVKVIAAPVALPDPFEHQRQEAIIKAQQARREHQDHLGSQCPCGRCTAFRQRFWRRSVPGGL